FSDLQAVVVVSGPGSYTGLRVGLSHAKGYCFALDILLIAHHQLELLARQVAVSEVEKSRKLVILEAREKEWFVAIYNVKNEVVLDPSHMSEEELLSLIDKELERGQLQLICTKEISLKTNEAIKIHQVGEIDIPTWAAQVVEKF